MVGNVENIRASFVLGRKRGRVGVVTHVQIKPEICMMHAETTDTVGSWLKGMDER